MRVCANDYLERPLPPFFGCDVRFYSRPKRTHCLLVLAIFVLFALGFSARAADQPLSYNNDIGPILSEHCFHCHGPDSASRKPRKHPLRLDRPDFAFETRDDGQPVIVKGKPDESEFMRRILATNDDVMPPAQEQKPLNAQEIAQLKSWITQGAKYEKHWSLIPPMRPATPADGAKWARNPIDHFVARKLAQNHLTPNSDEDRARLFRKLSFDLTGLPPDPKELAAFVRHGSDRAYEKAVDKMLASDACAEQFTRWWLDAVRYADTQGIHLDYARSVWPYRDWVINAYRTNMAFDRFTVEQLAGDMLTNATDSQKIASGYNRLLETTSEGGALEQEYAAIYAKDRVDTTSAVWLGLTTGCATCHDHKFDPITMKDFYSMTAFFRNNTSPIVEGPTANSAPMLFVPAKDDISEWRKLPAEIARVKDEIAARRRDALPGIDDEFTRESAAQNAAALPEPSLALPLIEASGTNYGHQGTLAISWVGAAERTNGPYGPAPLLKGGAVVEQASPVIGRSNQVTLGAFIYIDGHPTGTVFSRMDNDKGYRGWNLFLHDGKPSAQVIDQYSDRALEVDTKAALSPGKWHHIALVFDGRERGAKAMKIYVDGLRAEVTVNIDTLGTNIAVDVPFRLGGRTGKGKAADTLDGGRVYL